MTHKPELTRQRDKKVAVSPFAPLNCYARFWQMSHRADKQALPLADAHYSRQKPGTPQFVKPGACIVLLSQADALWVTSAPLKQYVKHAWAGAWECSMFRNESENLSSELIIEAVGITRQIYKEPPPLGMITFVDPRKVTGFFVRTKHGRELRWGYSFWQAGFEFCGWTKGGLYALRLKPERMPPPIQPRNWQPSLFSERA